MNFVVKIFKKVLKFLSSSKFMLGLAFVLNLGIWIGLTIFVSRTMYAYVVLISFVSAIIIVARSKDPIVYKFSWLILMIFLPLFGTVFYIYLKGSRISNRTQRHWEQKQAENEKYLFVNPQAFTNLRNQGFGQHKLAYFIQNATNMPVYEGAEAEYYETGELFFEALFEELEKAQKLIYLEFFIIRKGEIWRRLINILKSKASEGVDVKVLYDDYGCLDVFSKKRVKYLNKSGIEMYPFNKVRPLITRFTNYRDHRKIAIIDGRVAFTGGVNIADEYANLIERFGYWKDTGIKIEGNAVHAFMVMFATNWQIASKHEIAPEYIRDCVVESNGGDIVQVFGSGPIGLVRTAKKNYDNMINLAKDHLYISTPYFILDDETRLALKNCAIGGVDVKILLPGIPDKKIIYNIGKTFYRELLEAGIEIYELTGSFNHAKMIELDGNTASIGTANFDFRSLYLHFEDTVMLYKSQAILDIKADFERQFKQSKKVELSSLKRDGFFKRLYMGIIRLFMPLL